MRFVNLKSKHKIKIIDSCVLIDYVESRNLEQYLTKLSEKYDVHVSLFVKTETKDILLSKSDNPDDAIYFESSLKKLRNKKTITIEPKKNRLEKKFKLLKQHLCNSRPRVERVDRHIISLACQFGAKLCSKDPAIARAISKIRKASRFRLWKHYAEKASVQEP